MVSSRIVSSLLALGAVAVIVVACGNDDDGSKFDENKPPVGFGDGGFSDSGLPPDITADDPFPKFCGPDSGTPGEPVRGTPECPDDKNLPGCGCRADQVGKQFPCWEAARKFRNLGICKDGVTTCKRKDELTNAWGACEGAVLPTVNATGAAACSCFSIGEWKIDNSTPCTVSQDGTNYYSFSTIRPLEDTSQPSSNCQAPNTWTGPGQLPAQAWSKNRLSVDCAGEFTLEFVIRAGVFEDPKKDDCVLGRTTVQTGWVEASTKDARTYKELDVLPAWKGESAACSKKWENETPDNVSPGYGEMIVKGKTVECTEIGGQGGEDFVFHRIKYCPKVCRPSHPDFAKPENVAICKECQAKSTGVFTE